MESKVRNPCITQGFTLVVKGLTSGNLKQMNNPFTSYLPFSWIERGECAVDFDGECFILFVLDAPESELNMNDMNTHWQSLDRR